LNVRTSSEFNKIHIQNTKQLNYYGKSFKENLLLLQKDKPIYVYCKTGYSSKQTAELLIKTAIFMFTT